MPQPNDDRNLQAEAARVARIKAFARGPHVRTDEAEDLFLFINQWENACKRGAELTLEVLNLVEERSDLRDQIIALLKRKVGLEESHTQLAKALRSLTSEATGFIEYADQATHGVTNIRVLQVKIDAAREALKQAAKIPASAARCNGEGTIAATISGANDRDPRGKAAFLLVQLFLYAGGNIREMDAYEKHSREIVDVIVQASVAAARRTT